ncbi:cytochrome c [Accumulibacter sp.]|uniref:c-type cytochrome n=1 Tax=Accumulibacter sp. TaxID=2053492 RepID=UPI0025D79F9E|nr:cytochrome c [Accumulibacter sp.]MCM8624374.1 cytochrome c [Accumulibacter sp.]
MNRSLCALVLAGSLATPLLAAETKPAASTTQAPRFPYFVANCFNCHGTDGKSTTAMPSLAGRDREYIEETMKAYKRGERPATIMQQLAKGYTDDEIAILADYFSKQK